MILKKRLILNLLLICLATVLIIRDRSISNYLKVSLVYPNEPTIQIPGYLLACQEADSLRCEITVNHAWLVVESKYSPEKCNVTYREHIAPCLRIEASAADQIIVQNLPLSPQERQDLQRKIRLRSLLSIRGDRPLLIFLLGILSIWSCWNSSEVFYLMLKRIYPQQNRLATFIKIAVVLIGGVGVFLVLSIYFFFLLFWFGFIE